MASRLSDGDARILALPRHSLSSERHGHARPHTAIALPLVRAYRSRRALCRGVSWGRIGVRSSNQGHRKEPALMLYHSKLQRRLLAVHKWRRWAVQSSQTHHFVGRTTTTL